MEKNHPQLVYIPRLLNARAPLKQLTACGSWVPSVPRPQSLLLLFGWWTLCLRFGFIVNYLLPLVPIAWACSNWPGASASTSSKERAPSDSAEGTEQVLLALLDIESAWRDVISYIQWTDQEQSHELFLTMIYSYIGWVVANQFVATRYLILVIGTVVLSWQSPWVQAWRQSTQFKQARCTIMETLMISRDRSLPQTHCALIFQRRVMQECPIESDTIDQASNSIFSFVVYENQRYWSLVHKNPWQPPMPFMEREMYTDKNAFKTSPTSAFVLPGPVKMTSNTPVRFEKESSWSWVEEQWHLVTDKATTDSDGWEYGTSFWTLFSKQPRFWLPTRRRRWTRLAQIKTIVQVDTVQPNVVLQQDAQRGVAQTGTGRDEQTRLASQHKNGDAPNVDTGNARSVLLVSSKSAPVHIARNARETRDSKSIKRAITEEKIIYQTIPVASFPTTSRSSPTPLLGHRNTYNSTSRMYWRQHSGEDLLQRPPRGAQQSYTFGGKASKHSGYSKLATQGGHSVRL